MNDASPSATNDADNSDVGASSSGGHDAGNNALEQGRVVQRQLTLKFLDDLIRSIDLIIYCELSILYYMECVLRIPIMTCQRYT